MSSPALLPVLTISLLNDVPDWEASAEYYPRSKVEFAIRHLDGFKQQECSKKSIRDWSVRIYRAEIKNHDALAALIPDNDTNPYTDESEEDNNKGYCEYLIFLFRQTLGENNPVFVLSTSKAYKYIRGSCSDRFSKNCSARLSHLLIRVQQFSTGQLFGSASDSVTCLQQPIPETVGQSSLICRSFTAVYRSCMGFEGAEIKIKFKENGIEIYKGLSLEQYVQIIEHLSLPENTNHYNLAPPWGIPGVPDGNLVEVPDEVQRELHRNTCLHLAGTDEVEESKLDHTHRSLFPNRKTTHYTFNLRLSERWYSNAVNFRLLHERRRYGYNARGALEVSYYEIPKRHTHPHLGMLKDWLFDSLSGMRVLIANAIDNRQVWIEYQTTKGQWYGIPLIDCVEGWVRTGAGDVYFKMGSSWYQIRQEYVNLVQEAFNRVINTQGCLLFPRDAGYLHLPWHENVGETPYNKSYVGLNSPQPTPPAWFDGNQKFRSRVELFDILYIAPNSHIFLYHVKQSFDNDIRVAASQLFMSAQVVYNTRHTLYTHPDALETGDYCRRVGGVWQNRLLDALKVGTLHFVLAFRLNTANPRQVMLESASLIAKREVIRLKEEIEKLGFIFHISPIPS